MDGQKMSGNRAKFSLLRGAVALLLCAVAGALLFGEQPARAIRPAAATGATSAVATGNGDVVALSISADGRVFAFTSHASNLVVDDTNGVADVFIYNSNTQQVNRASLSNEGMQANAASYAPSLSVDGRYVAFESDATELVLDDTNGKRDIFVRDLITGRTERVSIGSGFAEANSDSFNPRISFEGRFIVFESDASNLVTGDTNKSRDIFIRDRHLGVTHRVSVSESGGQADRDSFLPSLSADGRYVVFESLATNLVKRDVNNASDIFLVDRTLEEVRRLSASEAGDEGNGPSMLATISSGGSHVAFRSFSTNLVESDGNSSWDVFLYEISTGNLALISRSSGGVQGNPSLTNPLVKPLRPSLSTNGRYVAYQSDAAELDPADDNLLTDIFVWDRMNSSTERVSVGSVGEEPNAHTFGPAISGSGRLVAFLSASTSLASNPGGKTAVFVHDKDAPDPTPTPTITNTPTSTPTPTATPTNTPTPTSTLVPVPQAYMPMLVHVTEFGLPSLARIDNSGMRNSFTVRWASDHSGGTFLLEEASSAEFTDARTVYSGPLPLWTATNKTPGTYYYRVRQVDGPLRSGWSAMQQADVPPLFVGLKLQWQGTGYLSSGETSKEIGFFGEEQIFERNDAGHVRSTGHQRFAPNPSGWPEETWITEYDPLTGTFVSSTLPEDPQQKWGFPWFLPYALDLSKSKAVSIDGRVFLVTGPLETTTVGEKPVRYWQLINRDRFLYRDEGGGKQEFVEKGNVELWYADSALRVLLRQRITRQVYENRRATGESIQANLDLTVANIFPE